MDGDVRVVLVAAPDADVAEHLAATLVEEGVAACGTVVPGARSVYRWKGEIRRDPEALLILKTTAARLDDLRTRVVALHPYEVPEVLSLPVDHGHEPYLAWVRAEVEATP